MSGTKKMGEGLVYLVTDTGAELKAWTPITGIPEWKDGSDQGYRSGQISSVWQLF